MVATSSPRSPRTWRAGLRPTRSAAPSAIPCVCPRSLRNGHTDGHVTGHVVHVDRFGNLITDIPGGWVGEGRWCVEIAGRRINQFGTTYADATAGALLILVSSAGTLEIAARDGNAAAQLGVGVGDAAILRPVV